MAHASGLRTSSPPDHPLARIIDALAHVLPAQGPISIFIHHNTLHAFEHLTFEDAVEQAGVRNGCQPFLAEPRYRDKLASGRILAKDVEWLLAEQLGAEAASDVAGVGSRLEFWRAVVLHGIPTASGRELSWILEETTTLSRFRTDLPAPARSALAAVIESMGMAARNGAPSVTCGMRASTPSGMPIRLGLSRQRRRFAIVT